MHVFSRADSEEKDFTLSTSEEALFAPHQMKKNKILTVQMLCTESGVDFFEFEVVGNDLFKCAECEMPLPQFCWIDTTCFEKPCQSLNLLKPLFYECHSHKHRSLEKKAAQLYKLVQLSWRVFFQNYAFPEVVQPTKPPSAPAPPPHCRSQEALFDLAGWVQKLEGPTALGPSCSAVVAFVLWQVRMAVHMWK